MQTAIQFRRGQYRITRFGGTQRLAADYGEIIGTKGADGEPIDVYQGLFPDADTAFIVNQYRPDGVFDEHKVMLHFYDQEQAAHAYALTTGKPPANIYPCTLQQLDWWLQFGNHKTPVTPQSFPFDSENMMQEQTHDWTNENQAAAKWLYAQRNDDPYGTLTEAATLDCIMQDELEDGAEIEEAVYDALAVANKRLERTAKLLGAAFNRASGSLKVVENGIQISAPMKKNGTTNVAVMFEMTDGQTVSVLLHNPDTTPAKITPDDVLISWKWLLNRKDITIVVAKENGKDLPLPTVARRVMALVEKNTARFAKANANKAAETELLAQLEAEKAEKITRLEELNRLVTEKAGQPENQDAPISITGNELGDFDTSTESGKKALREAVKGFLQGLRGKFVRNIALGRDVEIRQRGIKEMMRFSGNPKKLKLMSAIEQIIATAKPDGENPLRENEKKDKKPRALHYFHMKNQVSVDNEMIKFRVIFEEDKDGVLHYDVIIAENETATMDSTVEAIHNNKSWHSTDTPSGCAGNYTPNTDNAQATFDDAGGKWVLNLFLLDENGNEIKDEDDFAQDDETLNENFNQPENSEINPDTLPTHLDEDQADLSEAVSQYIKQNLQGKWISTQIGKVLFNAVSAGELKLGTKNNDIRAKLIPHVPQTLKKGDYLGRSELAKERKDRFVAFHTFEDTAQIDGQAVRHRVKVGERDTGEFVFIAYHSRGVFDDAKGIVFAPDTVSNNKAGRSEAHAIPLSQTIPASNMRVNAALDDIEDDADGWNIEIISVNEQPENHYSTQIIQALINDFGWKKSDDDTGENASISAVLEYHAPSRAGQLNSSGIFAATASFYPDLPRQRYLSLLVGFDEPINVDCRDDGLAGRYHEAAEKFDKQARAWLSEHEGAIFDNKEQPETEPVAPDAGMSLQTAVELREKYARNTFITRNLEDFLNGDDGDDAPDDNAIIDEDSVGYLNDYLDDKQKAVLFNRTAAFARALMMIEKVCNNHEYIVEFGNFEHTRSKGLFDGLRDYTQGYGIVAQIMDTNMFNRANVMRVDVDSKGRCVVFKYSSGTETLQKQRISYKNIKEWLDKTSESMTDEVDAVVNQQPENNSTQPNDRAFLQSVINGKEDAANEAVIDRILALAEQHEADADWQDLIEQAAEALAKAGIADTDDLAQGE